MIVSVEPNEPSDMSKMSCSMAKSLVVDLSKIAEVLSYNLSKTREWLLQTFSFISPTESAKSFLCHSRQSRSHVFYKQSHLVNK